MMRQRQATRGTRNAVRRVRFGEPGASATGGTGSPARRGFTLIELLVSVTLAIIILGMFAALYQWTTETYAEQKGNRRNDQRSRMMVIVLQGDLQLRTFKDVVPFVPGQRTDQNTGPNYVADRREGYFAISENDPDNDTDDVLALTVKIGNENTQLPFQGRARLLKDPNQQNAPSFTVNPDQPEYDDGQPTANNNGASRVAEVIYFLRNGNLYRRVLLVREPYDPNDDDAQPDQLTGDYTADHTPNGSGEFWRDFDYSAWYKFNGTDTGVKFHGRRTSLENKNPTTDTTAEGLPPVLGIPQLRYGYSLQRGPLPREFADGNFIGRFLLQETADAQFGYPGNNDNGDPHTRNDLTFNTNTGLVSEYNNATPPPRRGEDILMTNVHSFDVKVWDDPLSRFVDPGHSIAGGFYNRNNNNRGSGDEWNRFDTWHPFESGGTSLGDPPYKAGGLNAGLGSDQERPLRAVQITVRFFDVPTKKMRQVTIQETLD